MHFKVRLGSSVERRAGHGPPPLLLGSQALGMLGSLAAGARPGLRQTALPSAAAFALYSSEVLGTRFVIPYS